MRSGKNSFLTGFPGVYQLATATPPEMSRLNTAIAHTDIAQQHPPVVAAGDPAGFPNGRRPGDDAVDIGLRFVTDALYYPVPIRDELDLRLCQPQYAPFGNVALTDDAPKSATEFDNHFPHLVTPYAGSPGPSSATCDNGGTGGECVDTDGDGYDWNGGDCKGQP